MDTSVRVGLCFNLRSEGNGGAASGAVGDAPEDAQAEYDLWQTVSALAEALSFSGASRVVLLPMGPDMPRLLARQHPDVVFNIAEGMGGRSRESLGPALFELMGIPYTGSDPVTLGICMDKALAKGVVSGAGVFTTPSAVVESLDIARQLAPSLAYPAFVKPIAEGSSKGVRTHSRVDSPEELVAQVEWVMRFYRQPALVESFLPGREFSVGMVGNGLPEALPVLEVRPAPVYTALATESRGRAATNGTGGAGLADFVYCYHTKSRNLETFLCPAPVDEELRECLVSQAIRAFRALGIRDVARVDFRLDVEGVPRFMEVNPLPGLSEASLLTAQGQARGWDLSQLVARIFYEAAQRWMRTPELNPGLRARLQELMRYLGDRWEPAASLSTAALVTP